MGVARRLLGCSGWLLGCYNVFWVAAMVFIGCSKVFWVVIRVFWVVAMVLLKVFFGCYGVTRVF